MAAGGLSWLHLLGGGHWGEAHSCGQRARAAPAAAVAQLAAQALLRLAGPRWGLAGCLGVRSQGLAPHAAHALQGGAGNLKCRAWHMPCRGGTGSMGPQGPLRHAADALQGGYGAAYALPPPT